MTLPAFLDVATLSDSYRSGLLRVEDVVDEIIARRDACSDPAVWISRVTDADLRARAAELAAVGPSPAQPLWGIPFAVKDNIDCLGLPTTAACPDFAYSPTTDATAVARLKAAGAILVGKTNLDQFATGLNGARSPYGAPRCVFDSRYVSGGSSSGSAVAVGGGLASFALGTDTAGSGRIPAAFNNLVGLKPTRGLVPATGVVPACRSLDCVTVLAGTVGDAALVHAVMRGPDPADAWSRPMAARALPRLGEGLRFGVLGQAEREFFGDAEAAALYDAAIARLTALGGRPVAFDYEPFREAATLLYDGPWVAERLAAVEKFLGAKPDAFDPTVRTIIEGAHRYSAVDAFRGVYALEALRARTQRDWASVDVLLLPTAPTIYTVEAMLADPVQLNANLGRYTNFVNLLDCCAVAVPAGFRADGLPGGVTLVAPAFCDDALAALADGLHRAAPFGMGKDKTSALPQASRLASPKDDRLEIVVVGAHLSGMPLNHQLTDGGGWLARKARTAADYRMFALPDSVPPKPGLLREPGFAGPGLEVEVWSLPAAAFGSFVAAIPAPLGVGKVSLDDGASVTGFLCEPYALADAQDITGFGGWRAYMSRG